MDPVTAGILAGASMLSGIMGAKSAQRQRKADLLQSGAANQFQMAQNRLDQKQEMEQNALSDLIAAYRSGLAGG